MKIICLLLTLLLTLCAAVEDYSNNFYVILSSSKFYFNYRHSSNALIFYRYLKEMGIPDDQIVLMLPENHACNPRNKYGGQLFVTLDHKDNFYCDDIEVDFKGDDMGFDAILNLLRGRYPLDYPESKKLKTNKDSRLFIYFNGHGGENFFKIQDTDVLQSEDLGNVFAEMWQKSLYKETLMIMDTCQAMSLYDAVNSPNLFLVGSSNRDESAYSHQFDSDLNTSLNDKFTFYFYEFLYGKLAQKFTK